MEAVLQSSVLTYNCPAVVPTLEQTYRITCTDECGQDDEPSTVSGTALGACGGTPSWCRCLPTEGLELYGYGDPMTFEKTLFGARLSLCAALTGNVYCYQSGETLLHAECPCGGHPIGCDECPIILSLRDSGFALTDRQRGVDFDLNNNGTMERVPWTAVRSDEAFLALDRNGNGLIDEGRELFGNFTAQFPSQERNGFRALALFDDALNGGNEDGRITTEDSIFEHLKLWHDENHNGWSEAWELQALTDHGIEWIDLSYGTSARTDEFGNEFRYWSTFGLGNGESSTMWDVFFTPH
jgi:hypothetical protein